MTSHPWDLSDRLIAAISDCRSVCEHLHLPVQSGDDAVLRRMGRQYTIEHYLERLDRIREAVPGITVSTDVIVGFCGETDAQFRSTLRLLDTVRYDQVFAAAYSPRPGTPATRLPDDVPPDVKRRRLNELLALQEEIGRSRNEAWLGRDVEVLVDTITTPRSHDHDVTDAGAAARRRRRSASRCPVEAAATSSSTWSPTLAARARSRVRVEHAGPYALRGRLVSEEHPPLVDIGENAPLPWRLPEEFFTRTVRLDGCEPSRVRHMVEEDYAMDYSRLDRVRRSATPLELDLVENFAQGKITRRQFVKRATVIGLSTPFIGAVIAACSTPPAASVAPPSSGGEASPSAGASSAAPTGGTIRSPFTAGQDRPGR